MPVILIADDHPLYRDALKTSLSSKIAGLVVIESQDMDTTIAALRADNNIDLLLLDLHMPGSQDLFGLLHIRKMFPEMPVAVVSGLEEAELISKVINAGAVGFVPKVTRADEMADAIRRILDGDVYIPQSAESHVHQADKKFAELADRVSTLTPAQYRVMCMLSEGLLNKQIGFELGIAEKTVKIHVSSIFKKLNITNRSQAVLIASQLQLTPPEKG